MLNSKDMELNTKILKALESIGVINQNDKIITYLAFELKIGEPPEIDIRYIPKEVQTNLLNQEN